MSKCFAASQCGLVILPHIIRPVHVSLRRHQPRTKPPKAKDQSNDLKCEVDDKACLVQLLDYDAFSPNSSTRESRDRIKKPSKRRRLKMAGYTERNTRSGVWKGDLNSSPLRCMHGSIVAAWIISCVSPTIQPCSS
jgi:hypothetical protein